MSLRDVGNRWFLLGLCFLVVNSFAVFHYIGHSSSAGSIRAVFSAGTDGLVRGRDPLVCDFSSAVAAADAVGVRSAGCGPLRIVPAVAGSFCWESEKRLVFEPAENWRECTAYAVGFDDDFSAVNGEYLKYKAGAFHTAALALENIAQVDFGSSRRCKLRLKFNSIPVRSELKKYISVADGRGRSVDWYLLGGIDAKNLIIKTAPIMTEKYTVKLRKGLPAKGGLLALEQGGVWDIENSIDLRVGRVRPVSGSFEDGRMDVSFNAQPDLAQVEKFIEVEPPLKVTISKMGYYWSSGIRIGGEFAPGRQYTLTLKKGLPAENGAVLAADVVRQVYFPDRPKSVVFNKPGNYLSGCGSRLVSVGSVNISRLKVKSERIYPNNLVQYAMRDSDLYSGYHYWIDGSCDMLTQTVAEKEYSVTAKPNIAVETMLNMQELTGPYKSGAFLLTVTGDKNSVSRKLVVISDIGLAVKSSKKDLLVWADSIHNLDPVVGGEVKVYSEQNQLIFSSETDSNGIAQIAADMTGDKVPFLVTVARGDDITYLKLNGTKVRPDSNLGGSEYTASEYEAYLFSDRGIYRPGEMLHIKAVVRGADLGYAEETFPVMLKITGPDGRLYRSLNGCLNQWGSVAFDVALEKYIRTGRYRIKLFVPGSKNPLGEYQVAVEDFVPPQIRVVPETDQDRITSHLKFRVKADYLFGSPAAGLAVDSRVEFQPRSFMPQGWDGYLFYDSEKSLKHTAGKLGRKKLDAEGRADYSYNIPSGLTPASAVKVIAAVTVTEMSGRAVTAWLARDVDVYPYYVGIKRIHCGRVVRVGEQQRLSLAAVLPDGSAAADVASLKIELGRIEWSSVLKKHSDGSYSYESIRRIIPVSSETVELVDGRADYAFTPTVSDQYLLTASAVDGSGGSASIGFYAGSIDDEWQSWSLDKPGHVEIVCDRDEYKIGDVATLLIKSPFAGKALVTIESDRVISNRVVDMSANTTEISLPITAAMVPNVYCMVNVIRAAKPEKIWRAHRAVGAASLAVKMPQKRLNVEIDTLGAIRPKTGMQAVVQVTDAAGNGVAAELTVAAVDEGICMLTDFNTPDPLKYFMRKRRLAVEQFDLYNLLLPEVAAEMRGAASSVGGDAAAALQRRMNPIDAKRFKPLALWQKSVATDASGRAVLNFNIPEFSGEVRLMAVAVNRTALGSGSAAVKVKRDVTLLSSLPRFMAPNDKILLPVSILNGSDKDQKISLKFGCSALLTLDAQAVDVVLPPNASRSLEFELKAANAVGKAFVSISVESASENYEQKFELSVRPASPLISESDVGMIAAGESVTLSGAQKFMPSTVESELVCSGRATVKLKDSLDYLLRYPYGCLEQTVSGAFPLLYLEDLVAATKPTGMQRSDIGPFVQSGILRVLSMQQPDGSFSYWPNSREVYKWGSIYAVNFLIEAEKAGYNVPNENKKAAVDYLVRTLSMPLSAQADDGDAARRDEMRRRSYICYVLALNGMPQHGWTARLQELRQADTVTQLNLAAALAVGGERRKAAEFLSAIGVAGVDGDERKRYGCLSSPVRNTAEMLLVWLDIDPASPMVNGLVKQLNRMHLDGSWQTTQDNAMGLLALGKYAKFVRDGYKPFAGCLQLMSGGKTFVYEFSDKSGLTLKPQDIPPNSEITITNSGPGVVYYSLRTSGVPVGDMPAAADHGIKIRRELMDVDGNPIDDGSLHQGELVVVKLTLDTFGETLHNLAVEDLLPAGLEVENASLKTAEIVPWVKNKKGVLKVQHLDIRDDRVVMFIGSVSGSKSYYYVARAVTRGSFAYPAISVECMYDPQIFSRAYSGDGVLQVGE